MIAVFTVLVLMLGLAVAYVGMKEDEEMLAAYESVRANAAGNDIAGPVMTEASEAGEKETEAETGERNEETALLGREEKKGNSKEKEVKAEQTGTESVQAPDAASIGSAGDNVQIIYDPPQPQRVTEPVKHSHSYYAVSVKAPTCTSSGYTTYRCTCGEEKTESHMPACHDWVNGICTKCGVVCQTVSASDTPAATEPPSGDKPHTHQWDGGTETRQADCANSGTVRYTCTSCGEVREESIPASGHVYNSEGRCSLCGNSDNIFIGYGLYLKNSGLNEYDAMLSAVRFARKHGYGGCTGYSGMCKEIADYAGLNCIYRQIGDIQCPRTGEWHSAESFNADGYCNGCGLGDNHHWVRFCIGADYYEFDIFAGDTSCIRGANVSRY